MRGKLQWTYIESSDFQVARSSYLSDVEFEAIKEVIPRHPESWVELRGGPGLFALLGGKVADHDCVRCGTGRTESVPAWNRTGATQFGYGRSPKEPSEVDQEAGEGRGSCRSVVRNQAVGEMDLGQLALVMGIALS